jgi:hypothetical protein
VHVVETFVDVVQGLVVSYEFVNPKSTLQVVYEESYQPSFGGRRRDQLLTIDNAGHLSPSFDTSESGASPYSTCN